MSVQEIFTFQETVLTDWMENPRAWLLQANPVWGRFETVNRIALFDTKAQAEAYVEMSQLPKVENPELHKTKDGYYRTFRPDSLLFDYNPEASGRSMIVPAIPWHNYREVCQNPAPPSGPAPDVNGRSSDGLPRYGVDYDQGFGGHRSNMDGVLPRSPNA